MPCVTDVVTNVKLVIVHNSPFTLPKKETAAGEGGTLFGLLMTSDLAVFQTILHQLQVVLQVRNWPSP